MSLNVKKGWSVALAGAGTVGYANVSIRAECGCGDSGGDCWPYRPKPLALGLTQKDDPLMMGKLEQFS